MKFRLTLSILIISLLFITGCNSFFDEHDLLKKDNSTNIKSKTFTDKYKKFKITASDNYISENSLDDSIFSLINEKNQQYISIFSQEKNSFKEGCTLEDYKNMFIKNIQDNSKITDVDIPVKNYTTKSFIGTDYDKTTEIVEKQKMTYIVTLVETDTHFYQIMTWTVEANFENTKEEFTNIIKSFEQAK